MQDGKKVFFEPVLKVPYYEMLVCPLGMGEGLVDVGDGAAAPPLGFFVRGVRLGSLSAAAEGVVVLGFGADIVGSAVAVVVLPLEFGSDGGEDMLYEVGVVVGGRGRDGTGRVVARMVNLVGLDGVKRHLCKGLLRQKGSDVG